MMRSTLSTFTKHTIGRVRLRTSTKQRSITLVVRSLRHRCRGKAKKESKFGPYSIKSAFEIDHSTSVYSGILRLSDLRAEAPNSNYPLFIVASEDRRRKVFEELRRPTFSGPCLRLNEVIRFLVRVREAL